MQVNKRQFRYKVFAGFTRVTLKTFKTFKLPHRVPFIQITVSWSHRPKYEKYERKPVGMTRPRSFH